MNEVEQLTKTVILWGMAALLIFSMIALPTACTMRRQQLVADAIKAGADPMSAKCAIESSDGDRQLALICMAKAMEKR